MGTVIWISVLVIVGFPTGAFLGVLVGNAINKRGH
jgi:hypothetical protein